jgi:hypothetical protein
MVTCCTQAEIKPPRLITWVAKLWVFGKNPAKGTMVDSPAATEIPDRPEPVTLPLLE